jgi:hypothetical protein
MESILKKFEQLYLNFNLDNENLFYDVYEERVQFIDPFHLIHGATDLLNYFKRTMKNVEKCQFIIKHIGHTNDVNAFVTWDMKLIHPSLNKGKEFTVPGTTHLIIKDKVILHRDYFNGADLIYKRIPVLGSIIKTIERNV